MPEGLPDKDKRTVHTANSCLSKRIFQDHIDEPPLKTRTLKEDHDIENSQDPDKACPSKFSAKQTYANMSKKIKTTNYEKKMTNWTCASLTNPLHPSMWDANQCNATYLFSNPTDNANVSMPPTGCQFFCAKCGSFEPVNSCRTSGKWWTSFILDCGDPTLTPEFCAAQFTTGKQKILQFP